MVKKMAVLGQRLLPATLRRMVRRRYYRGVVDGYRAEAWEWAGAIRPWCTPGADAIDAGANVGYISKLLAEWVGPNGRVVSIEPVPDTFDVLQDGMRHRFGSRVTCVPRCLSDAPGEVTMVVPEYDGVGGENFYESRIAADPATAASGRAVTVQAETLDAIVARTGMVPAFIKIDVEGHELAVVRGAEKTIRAGKPPLLIEVAGDPDEPGTQAALLLATLMDWGYTPHTINHGVLKPRRSGDQSVDYLFLVAGQTTESAE
jgi:FkbM family methyltransferase